VVVLVTSGDSRERCGFDIIFNELFSRAQGAADDTVLAIGGDFLMTTSLEPAFTALSDPVPETPCT
jgi:hypothetical protein